MCFLLFSSTCTYDQSHHTHINPHTRTPPQVLLACSRPSFWKAIESRTKYVSRMDHLEMFHTIPVDMWASERKDIAQVLLNAILDTKSKSVSCQRSMSCLLDIDMSDSLCASPRVEIEKIARSVVTESADALVRAIAHHLKTASPRPLHDLRGSHDDAVCSYRIRLEHTNTRIHTHSNQVHLLLSLMRHSDWFLAARDTMRSIKFWDTTVDLLTTQGTLSPSGCVELVRCFCTWLKPFTFSL